jgi:hypothetical protein
MKNRFVDWARVGGTKLKNKNRIDTIIVMGLMDMNSLPVGLITFFPNKISHFIIIMKKISQSLGKS